MDAFAPDSLLAHLASLPDPRSRHGRRFPLIALLATACAAAALRAGLLRRHRPVGPQPAARTAPRPGLLPPAAHRRRLPLPVHPAGPRRL